jgi:hypothetical protein
MWSFLISKPDLYSYAWMTLATPAGLEWLTIGQILLELIWIPLRQRKPGGSGSIRSTQISKTATPYQIT